MDRSQLEAREMANLRAEALVDDKAGTGAKRSDCGVRFDLIPPEALFELARRFAIGAEKYGDFNWRNGLTGKNSPLNHLEKHINEYKFERLAGRQYADMSDAHLSAIIWNVAAEIFYRCHPEWYDETNRLRPHLELDEQGIPRLKTVPLTDYEKLQKLADRVPAGVVNAVPYVEESRIGTQTIPDPVPPADMMPVIKADTPTTVIQEAAGKILNILKIGGKK